MTTTQVTFESQGSGILGSVSFETFLQFDPNLSALNLVVQCWNFLSRWYWLLTEAVDFNLNCIITVRKRSLGQGNVFNRCSSAHGGRGVCIQGVCIQGRSASRGSGWADPPPLDTIWYGQRVGSTHPTGMHCCLIWNCSEISIMVLRRVRRYIFQVQNTTAPGP